MQLSYSQIAERHLSKDKKYYTQKVRRKDKENIIEGDIDSIIEQLSFQKTPRICLHPKLKRSSNFLSSEKDKGRFLQNCQHFFEKDQQYLLKRKQLRKQIAQYLSKMKQPSKEKNSLYQQYILLAQETADYLEYYLTNFGGKDQETTAQLLKEEGKIIILLILRKKFECFEKNPADIVNRILLSFHLNPLNDFQFISWEKFMKIRKLINGDFNRQESNQFILEYFFTGSEETITGVHFWAIFTSVIRKIGAVLSISSLNSLINRILEDGQRMIGEEQTITKEELRKIIHEDPLFIWKQFVILIFI